jgi:hypothetical protein
LGPFIIAAIAILQRSIFLFQKQNEKPLTGLFCVSVAWILGVIGSSLLNSFL